MQSSYSRIGEGKRNNEGNPFGNDYVRDSQTTFIGSERIRMPNISRLLFLNNQE